MDVHIGEMQSTVRATDSGTLLSPGMLEQIVRAVLERVREEQAYDRRVADERRLRPGVSADEHPAWES
jgi:hypothetical protein